MAIYHWKGLEAGQHSDGTIEAPNLGEAKAQLKLQKIILTNIQLVGGSEESSKKGGSKPASVSTGSKHGKFKARAVKSRDLMIFTKKFATMIQSGLPILKTLNMLENQTEDKNFKKVLNVIYTDVESGTTLSDAFERHPKVFDSIYINLLRAGETSGKLTTFLYKLVVQIEKSEKIKAKVKGALTYPTILVVVATVVVTLMLVKVVPVFEQMFSSMGNNLPGPTQMIVNASKFLRDPSGGGMLFAVIVGTFITIRFLIKNNPKFRYKFHELLTRIPLVRDVIQKSALSKIAMVEGNLSAAGVSVIESLDIIASSINNEVYRAALRDVREGIKEGEPLSVLYGKHDKVFSSTFVQMIQVGEETGNMDEMFESIARYFEEEFDMVVDRMTELLEPFMIVFMGLTIGFIIVAMYMPIFEIGKTMMPH